MQPSTTGSVLLLPQAYLIVEARVSLVEVDPGIELPVVVRARLRRLTRWQCNFKRLKRIDLLVVQLPERGPHELRMIAVHRLVRAVGDEHVQLIAELVFCAYAVAVTRWSARSVVVKRVKEAVVTHAVVLAPVMSYLYVVAIVLARQVRAAPCARRDVLSHGVGVQ